MWNGIGWYGFIGVMTTSMTDISLGFSNPIQKLLSHTRIHPLPKLLSLTRQYYHTKLLSQAANITIQNSYPKPANTPLPNINSQNESQNDSVLILRLSHPICGGNANDKISFFVSRLRG